MPVGRRTAPDLTGSIKAATRAGDPDITAALHDLALDAIECLRAMMEHGSTEDRIAATKALTPLLKELNVGQVDTDDDAATKARDMLLGHWEGLV